MSGLAEASQRRGNRRVRLAPLVALLLVLGPGCLLSTGCALRTTRTGLVGLEDQQVVLQQQDGRLWRVARAGEGEVVAGLQDCEVEVVASRLGRRLVVQEWTVLSAPGGGQPYVGRLRLFGSNWLIDDRSTGRPVILDLAGSEDLARHEGSTVLVVGFVSGAQTIRVVQWRVVAP